MAYDTYALDMAWPLLMKQLGIRAADVLRRAELPADLLARTSGRLSTPAYFRFWEALAALARDELWVLRLAEAIRAESFSPPLFAALCSPNLLTALRRLAVYKKLVAPMRLDVEEAREKVSLSLVWIDDTQKPPPALVVAELLFFVSLARLGTHERVSPVEVVTTSVPTPRQPYEDFVGCSIRKGRANTLVFAKGDATRPFLSCNESMWAIFEPSLAKRAADLEASSTTTERVRAALLEALPSGNAAVEIVAQRLATSTRTLQRRLEDEGTSFQRTLRETREALAMHYLERTALPVAEIAFLLGFGEANSFFRAFSEWTGRTPESFRRDGAPSSR